MTWLYRLIAFFGSPPLPPPPPPPPPAMAVPVSVRLRPAMSLDQLWIVRLNGRAVAWGLAPEQARENAWIWAEHDHELFASMMLDYVWLPRGKIIDHLAMLGLALTQTPFESRCA